MGISAEAFGEKSGTDQRAKWRRATRAAEWAAASGPQGSLILKQRSRGHRADRLAIAFLVALIVTVLLGLAYYVAVPLWQQFYDAERRAYEAQVEILDGQLAALDRERDDLWEALVSGLSMTATRIESPVDTHLSLLRAMPDGKTIVAVDEQGGVIRSADGGRSWTAAEREERAEERPRLYDLRVLPSDESLVWVGESGAIFRSADTAETWNRVDSGVDFPLFHLRDLPDGETLIAVGASGDILRSIDWGDSWEIREGAPRTEIGLTIILFRVEALADGKTLVAVGSLGTILRSVDAGESWSKVESGVSDNLFRIEVLPDDTTLLAIGEAGTITRSTDAGENWTRIESGVTQRLYDIHSLPDGETLFAVGEGGMILRSPDAGATWEVKTSPVSSTLSHLLVLPDGVTLVAAGWKSSMVRSIDAGDTWELVDSGTPADLTDFRVMPDGTTIVGVGLAGAIALFDDRHDKALDGISLAPGRAGDEQMRAAFFELPEYVRGSPARREMYRQFEEAIADRPTLVSQRQAAQAAAGEIATGGFSLSQRREDFAEFMARCRGEEGQADTGGGCADAYVALREAETPGPWQVLADRVPQAVLLLFLLATLGGLYRYNLRLAGFYHARADALELLGQDKDGTAAEVLDKLGTALAADKVEFGKGNTPSDQATELAKTIMARSG